MCRCRMTPVLATLAGLAPIAAGYAGEDPSTVAILESKGIVRAGSGFVLRAESDVQPRVVALRTAVAGFESARAELMQVQAAVDMIPRLEQEAANLRLQIGNLNSQMGQFPGTNRGGRTVHGNSMNDENAWQMLRLQRDELQANLNQIAHQRETLRIQAPGRRLGPAQEAFGRTRDAALGAMRDLRATTDAVATSYNELSESDEVKRALARIGGARFGPSPEFGGALENLARYERWAGLRPEGVPLKASAPDPHAAPSRPQASPPSDTGRLLRLAEQTEKNGKTKGALDLYRDVIKRNPGGDDAKRAAERIKALTQPPK